MLKVTTRRLFPLHIAPIDNFFLVDDREAYPMTFVTNLFFSGTFDRAALQSALDDALQQNPLLQANIALVKQGKPCWVPADTATSIDWGTVDECVDEDFGGAIDLEKQTGLRIWVRQGVDSEGVDKARMILRFHHACCDGTGAHRFIGDLLAGYGMRMAGPNDELPTAARYDPLLLRSRNPKMRKSFGMSPLMTFRQSLLHGLKVFGKRIAPLQSNVASVSGGEPATALPGVVSHTFSKDEHKQLRGYANRGGATLNDLLLAETFLASRQWNRKHGSSWRQQLRIMMPLDMRGKQEYAMPAANMTTYNFITRSMRACDDMPALVRGIRDETSKMKQESKGSPFIDAIMSARTIPGLLPLLLSGRRCLSTVTVSHMGDPTRRFVATFPRKNGKIACGNVLLDNWLGVSPLRPQTRASVSIVTLYRQLTISVRCDPHNMSVSDSQSFLDLLVRQMRAHLA